MNTRVYFDNIENIVLEELSKANNTVLLLVAWLTNKKLFAKLVELAERGVRVNVIINYDEINRNSFLDYARLNYQTSFIKMIQIDNGNILHHKFCIIDDKTVINGSYNWTYKANYNHENINIIEDNKDLVIKYQNEFRKILYNVSQQTVSSNKENPDKQIMESFEYAESDEKTSKIKDAEFIEYLEQEEKKFRQWIESQKIYEKEFIWYLDNLNVNLHYNFGCDTNAEYLESHIEELLTFYKSNFNKEHPSFIKYLFHNIINAFKKNIDSPSFTFESTFKYHSGQKQEIKPYFNSRVKEVIYLDSFKKSINAYQFKLSLILLMLDFAYEDFKYNGILIEPWCNHEYIDYAKEPKVFSSEVIEKLKFIRDVKLDDFDYKILNNNLIEINNCIRYFNNGMHFDIFLQPEYSKNAIQDLKNIEEYKQELRDSELEFRDTIIKMNVSEFDKIKNEIKKNGLVNTFELAKTITAINMNIDNLDFITNESELKTLIRDFIEQKVIIKDVVYDNHNDTYKLVALQWSFEKSRNEIKKEIIMIHYLWSYFDFETKYDVWKKLDEEYLKNIDADFYIRSFQFKTYLNRNNIEVDDFLKEDKKHQDLILDKALKEINIPSNFPYGFNIFKLFNSLKVNIASMPVDNKLVVSKEIKNGKVLNKLFDEEFAGMSSNIQINESIEPFTWMDNGSKIRVNQNAKRCKNTGRYLLKDGSYIFRQTTLILGEPKNKLIEHNNFTDSEPNYSLLEFNLNSGV